MVGAGLRGGSAAHTAGIVHRDLKPENLFLLGGRPAVREDSRFRDLEVRPAHDRRAALTLEGSASGTPYYMSPEQIRGDKNIDAARRRLCAGRDSLRMPDGRQTVFCRNAAAPDGFDSRGSLCAALDAPPGATSRVRRGRRDRDGRGSPQALREHRRARERARSVARSWRAPPRCSHVARHPRGVGGNRSARNACRLPTQTHPRIGATSRAARTRHVRTTTRAHRVRGEHGGPDVGPSAHRGFIRPHAVGADEEGTCRRLGSALPSLCSCRARWHSGSSGRSGTPAESEPAAAAPSSAPPAPTQVSSGPRAEVVVGAPEPPASAHTLDRAPKPEKKRALGSSLRYGPDAPTELTCPRARALSEENPFR